MAWKWTDIPGAHPYTFTSVHGHDYAVHCVSLETRENVSTQMRGDKTIIRSLTPAKSTFGDIIAPRPCFPSHVGLGSDAPLEGILHGGTLRLECMIFCPRYAPQGCVAYHVIDLETYWALGGSVGHGTEWPTPAIPYMPSTVNAGKSLAKLPKNMVANILQLRPSDN